MSTGEGLLIGEVSGLSGVSRHALRYYERAGILAPPPRTASGYRVYPPDTVERLAFLRKAQALGLRLTDVKEILDISGGGRQPCEHVRELVAARLEEVDQRLRELGELRHALLETLASLEDAPGAAGCRCPAIESVRAS